MDKYKVDPMNDSAIMDNEGSIIALCLDMTKASECNLAPAAKIIVARENARKNAQNITRILNTIHNLKDSLVGILISVESIDMYAASKTVSEIEKKKATDKIRNLIKDLSDEA